MAENNVPITADEISNIIKQVLDEVIGKSVFNPSESSVWNQRTVELITRRLVELNKPYKYLVNCALLQIPNGSGLNVSSVSFWNKDTDVSVPFRWESKHMLAVVYVYAVKI